jgi:hypothetical protein
MARRHFLLCLLLCLGLLPGLRAAPDKVIKVLPHLVDKDGKHALSPSLFERDAYQAILRKNPDKVGGMQYDVQYKAAKTAGRALKLRLELVTTKHPKGKPFTLTEPVKPAGGLGRWTRVKLDAGRLKEIGEIIAWRVSLLDGEESLSAQNSFLW